MLGFIHPSERYAEPRLGEVLNARIISFGGGPDLESIFEATLL